MKTSTIALALFCGSMSAAVAAPPVDRWTAAERIGSFGWSNKVAAIDAAGNAVALWTQGDNCPGFGECVFSRERPKGGAWGPTSIRAVLNTSSGTYLALYMTDGGRATAIWRDDTNLFSAIFVADKPLGGAWTKPVQLAGVAGYNGFVSGEDRAGDTAVVDGNTVVIRHAGGVWGKPLVYTTVDPSRVAASDVQLSTNGDAVVGYVVYHSGCNSNNLCNYDNVLHVARLRHGSSAWQDSGPLSAPGEVLQAAKVAIDDNGRAGAVISTSKDRVPRVYTTTTSVQPDASHRWSAPVSLPTNAYAAGFGSDAAGDATLLLSETVNGTDRVVAYGASLGVGVFTLQSVLSAPGFQTYAPRLAVSSSGSANVIWLRSDLHAKSASVMAASRASAAAPWTAPTDLAPKTPIYYTESVAAAGNGQSVAIWSGYVDPDGSYYPNAAVHRP